MAKWVFNNAQNIDNCQAEIVDLNNYPMPFFDESMPPQANTNRQINESVQKWLNSLAQGDAFVIITPEYNRSIPAVLKNALDYIDFQLAKKPVCLVSHGSSGGAQALSQLRAVLAGLKTFSTPTSVYLVGRAGEMIDEDGNLIDEKANQSIFLTDVLKLSLEELQWYGEALAKARS